MLSGLLSNENCFCSCFTTHSMHCTFEQTLQENADLKQKLNCFWEIENVNPFDECVISQFEEDSDFNGER